MTLVALYMSPMMETARRNIHHTHRMKKYFWLNRLLDKMQRKLLLSGNPAAEPIWMVHDT